MAFCSNKTRGSAVMKFMDFCSGIGGGRLGLEENNIECVAHSEINDVTDRTYSLFFGKKERNYGDLVNIDTNELPSFDILIAGFPCQTFSIVGKREGFEDCRGQIIYGLIKIMTEKDVPYFILENVKGLVNHNKGETLKEILRALSEAGYIVDYKVLNSENYGVPQFRERIYFIGIRKDLVKKTFKWPTPTKTPELREYLIDTDNDILDFQDPTWQRYINNKYNKGRFDFSEILKEDYLVLDWRQSDLRLYRGKTPTLRTGRHGILYVKDGKLKKLSGYEGLLLQGFPKALADKAKREKINNTELLSQAGNAMSVPVIRALGKALLECVRDKGIMEDLALRGSKTAKDGFKNETDVANKFNNWEADTEAREWLTIMNYDLNDIESVRAVVITGYKTDVNVQVQVNLKNAVDTENIQVKLVSIKKGFNQVDKRSLDNYKELWDIPEDVYETLQYFTGEKAPYKANTKDSRRMFLNEMEECKQNAVVKWFSENKTLILSDIIKGRGKFSAEWVLVAQKVQSDSRWVLRNINEVLQHYAVGEVKISPKGSLTLGSVLVQRKGGDGGRDTAKMLQFKLNPASLFDI